MLQCIFFKAICMWTVHTDQDREKREHLGEINQDKKNSPENVTIHHEEGNLSVNSIPCCLHLLQLAALLPPPAEYLLHAQWCLSSSLLLVSPVRQRASARCTGMQRRQAQVTAPGAHRSHTRHTPTVGASPGVSRLALSWTRPSTALAIWLYSTVYTHQANLSLSL